MTGIYNKIKCFYSSELGKGSLILFITIGIYNVLNFIFHFSMGRLLGPEDYGILAVLMSLIYIYSIPSEAIQNVITKYSSSFNSQKKLGNIKYLLRKALNKGFRLSLIVFAAMIIVSIFLSNYLGISIWLILITNLIIISSFTVPVVRGVLQGRKKFGKLGVSMILESFLKLFFAVSLSILGFKVFGAMIGVALGVLSGFIFSLYFNKEVTDKKEEKTSFDGIYLTSVPYFISMLVVLLILSIDIILAKRFFTPDLSGQYAVLSMLGKMIFFGTGAINKAMFPLTCERTENNKDSKGLFKKSFFFLSLISLFAIAIYYLIPELVIKILYGEQYLIVAPLLFYSGIALMFLSLTNLNLVYSLSVNKLRKASYLFIFVFLEIILLYKFHNSLKEYILAFMVSNIIMFIASFLFIRGNGKKDREHCNASI